MSPIFEMKPIRAPQWRTFGLGLMLLAACGAEVPRSAPWAPPELVDPPDTRPRTFVVRGDVVDSDAPDVLTPVPRATVSFVWVDRGRLETAHAWCDDAGRFELWTKPGQYVPPDTHGTLFATSLGRLAFASHLAVPVGGVEHVQLVGKGAASRTCNVTVRDGEGDPLEHGTLDPHLLLSRPPPWSSSPAKSRLHGSPVQVAAPSLPFELVVTASGFTTVTLGPFDSVSFPPSLDVELAPLPKQRAPDLVAPTAAPVVVRDVVGTLVPPRGVPADKLELQVGGFGYRGIARDGSFLLPDLPVGTHVVYVAESRGILERAHVDGREWDTSIVCNIFGTSESEFGLQALGFLVDVGADSPGVVQRDVDLRGLPACRIEGRIALEGASPATLEGALPNLAQLRHPPSGAIICDAVVAADGRFVLGLDEPREVQLVLWNPSLHFGWRLRHDLILQREPITWTRQLITGRILLEPAWIEGELRPPAELVVWQGERGLDVTVHAWEEDPVTRQRRFECVPVGPAVLHGRRPACGERVPVGTVFVEPIGVTAVRLER
jgi:hypothetical protein